MASTSRTTWNLWHNKRSNAVLIEGDSEKMQDLQRNTRDFPGVTCLGRFVGSGGPNSLDGLLREVDAPDSFELLSIDVDGDDYHIWKSLESFRPKVVIIECNPTFCLRWSLSTGGSCYDCFQCLHR